MAVVKKNGARLQASHGQNHRCFTKQFNQLVAKSGGQWVVISGGEVIRIGPKRLLTRMVQQAKMRHPGQTPLVAPIPTDKDLQCIL